MKERLFNLLPYFFLAVGILLTVTFFRNELKRHEQNQRTYYRDQVYEIRKSIEYRLQNYVDEQIAGAAFISASREVTRQEWRSFVTALKLDINYPGINGLGFAVPVAKPDSLKFVQEIQRENMPWFGVKSLEGQTSGSDFFVIKYIEPQYRNRQALGLDMGSEPLRRAAMESARDKGQPMVSRKVVLVQDQNKTPGFLIYVPVYKAGADTVRSQFLGWSFAPFIAEHFMKRLLSFGSPQLSKMYEVELYDGAGTDAQNLLFASWKQKPALSKDTYNVTFPVYGNRWTLRLVPLEVAHWAKEKVLAYVILIGGLLLSTLLFFLMQTLANTRRRALALAESMTQELRTLNQNLDRKVEERTRELADKNKQLSNYAENLKIAYEDLEVKVKFRNLELEKKVKALQEENRNLKK